MIRQSRSFVALFAIVSAFGCGGSGSNNSSATNADITVSIAANHFSVSLGQPVILNWSSTNASSCLASSAPPEGDWTALLGTSGSATVTPAAFGGVIFSLTCTGTSGSVVTASTSIKVNSAGSGLVNGARLDFGLTYWLGNNCILDGHTIQSLTILGNSGQEFGDFYDGGEPALGVSPVNAGGRPATWTSTGDGRGMLINYTVPQCSRTPISPAPVSLLNITGSIATGKFSSDLTDQKGAVASCSFALAKPQNPVTVCF